MFQTKVVEKIKTHILRSIIFFQDCAIYEIMWKILYSQVAHRWQCGTHIFHAGYLRLQTHAQIM